MTATAYQRDRARARAYRDQRASDDLKFSLWWLYGFGWLMIASVAAALIVIAVVAIPILYLLGELYVYLGNKWDERKARRG